MKTILIIGRPNVGKSTLANTLSETKMSITSPTEGTTRDFVEQYGEWQGKQYKVIDTAGLISTPEHVFEEEIQGTIDALVAESDIIFFVTDVRTGILEFDRQISKKIKQTKKDIYLIANKVDSPQYENDALAFASLGFGTPIPVSALSGKGVGDMLEIVTKHLQDDDVYQDDAIGVALLGKVNAGKSTLFNVIAEEKRVVESDMPGTTVDVIEYRKRHKGKEMKFYDTAGLRKKTKIDSNIEFKSYKKSLGVLRHIDIACLVIDGSVPLTRQDQRIAFEIEDSFLPTVIVVNKADLLSPLDDEHQKNYRSVFGAYEAALKERLGMLYFANVLFISAKEEFNTNALLNMLVKIDKTSEVTVEQKELDSFLEQFAIQFPPRSTRTRKSPELKKLRLASANPAVFELKISKGYLSDNYLKHMTRSLHKHLKLFSRPLRIRVVK